MSGLNTQHSLASVGFVDERGCFHRLLGVRDGRCYWQVEVPSVSRTLVVPDIVATGGADTATLYSHADDGYIQCSWPTSGEDPLLAEDGLGTIYYDTNSNEARAGRGYFASPPSFVMYRGVLFFDTSSIPSGSVVSAGAVIIRGRGKQAVQGAYYIQIVPYTGSQPATSRADFQAVGITEYAKIHYDDFGVEEDNTFTLSSAGLTQINPGGTTQFAVRTPRSAAYSYAEYVIFWTANNDAAIRPRLSVTYSTTAALSVNIGGTWKSASGIWVNVDGAWKTSSGIWANVGGTWKQV